jgi:hypothetical protein
MSDGSHIEAEIAHEHDEDAQGGGHGHGHDPNAGVVKGEPPTPAWIWTAALIALVTALGTVWLAFAIG